MASGFVATDREHNEYPDTELEDSETTLTTGTANTGPASVPEVDACTSTVGLTLKYPPPMTAMRPPPPKAKKAKQDPQNTGPAPVENDPPPMTATCPPRKAKKAKQDPQNTGPAPVETPKAKKDPQNTAPAPDESANVHKYSQAELDKTRALVLGPDRIEKLDSAKRRLAAAAVLTPIEVPPSIQMPSLEEVEACAEAVDPYKQDASEVLDPNREAEAVSTAEDTQDAQDVD